MKILLPSSPVRLFLTTSCLLLAISTSSFAMGPKRVETQEQRKTRLATEARAAAAEQQRLRDATAGASADSSAAAARAEGLPTAVDSKISAKGVTPSKKKNQKQSGSDRPSAASASSSSAASLNQGVEKLMLLAKSEKSKEQAQQQESTVPQELPAPFEAADATEAEKPAEAAAVAEITSLLAAEARKKAKAENGEHLTREAFLQDLAGGIKELEKPATQYREEAKNELRTKLVTLALDFATQLQTKYSEHPDSAVDNQVIRVIDFKNVPETGLSLVESEDGKQILSHSQEMTRLEADCAFYEYVTDQVSGGLEALKKGNLQEALETVNKFYQEAAFQVSSYELCNGDLGKVYQQFLAQVVQDDQRAKQDQLFTKAMDEFNLERYHNPLEALNAASAAAAAAAVMPEQSQDIDLAAQKPVEEAAAAAVVPEQPQKVDEAAQKQIAEAAEAAEAAAKEQLLVQQQQHRASFATSLKAVVVGGSAAAVRNKEIKGAEKQPGEQLLNESDATAAVTTVSTAALTAAIVSESAAAKSRSPLMEPSAPPVVGGGGLNNTSTNNRPSSSPSSFSSPACRALSIESLAVVAAALAYEWYLHSLQQVASSQAAS